MIIALLYGLLSFTGLNENPDSPERVWHVRNESRLAISGESNLNDFMCDVDRYYTADNLLLYSDSGTDYTFSSNRMIIDLMEFDCGRALITRDFRHTLNADKNPEVTISFLSMDRVPSQNDAKDTISGIVEIMIAGVTKRVMMLFTVAGNGNGITYLNGKHGFLFSDFNLKPPSRVLGLINVKNELEVRFDLVLEERPFAAVLPGSQHLPGRRD